MYWSLLLTLLIAALSACLLSYVAASYADDVFSRIDTANVDVSSYLFRYTSASSRTGVAVIQETMKLIHSIQHPPNHECSDRRLLVVNMKSNTFEGTGSLVKQFMIALSQALHSNRTLVWGLSLPHLYERSRSVWAGEERMRVDANGIQLDCSNADDGQGPFACFFEPISGCSIADASSEALNAFINNPYNDSAMIVAGEYRRAVSLYYPPEGLFDLIDSKLPGLRILEDPIVANYGSHLWAAAVAAYVFRLKKDVVEQFVGRHRKQLSHSYWSMHIRHGDLKALKDVYKNKQVFDEENYFDAAMTLSHSLKQTPSTVFISTDSLEAESMPKQFISFSKRYSKRADRRGWYATKPVADSVQEQDKKEMQVQAWVVPDQFRYRTAHGSHTVAAGGGCYNEANPATGNGPMKQQVCSLRPNHILQHQNEALYQRTPKAIKIMRVLSESVEDIFLLSLGDVLIAQSSSHFSTLAALLVWARTGGYRAEERIAFLDEEAVEQGVVPTSFLEAMNMLNSTYGLDPRLVADAGEQRWMLHTNMFLSGLANADGSVQSSPVSSHELTENESLFPWHAAHIFKIDRLLPQLDKEVYYREAATWLGQYRNGRAVYLPIWPNSCPARLRYKDEDPLVYVERSLRLGEHHNVANHPGQAYQCWDNALRVVNAIIRRKVNTSLVKKAKSYLLVINQYLTPARANFADEYRALLLERADAFRYLGIISFDTMQFQLREGITRSSGQVTGAHSTLTNEVGFSEFLRLKRRLPQSDIYHLHGYRTTREGMNSSDIQTIIEDTQRALDKSRNIRDALLKYSATLKQA